MANSILIDWVEQFMNLTALLLGKEVYVEGWPLEEYKKRVKAVVNYCVLLDRFIEEEERRYAS